MADNIKAPAVRIVIGEYEIPAVCSMEPLDFLSKEGLAAFAALSGEDDLRHYCEYLKARGYAGDAYADFRDRDGAKGRVQWAVTASRKIVTNERELRDYMRNPGNLLAEPRNQIPAINAVSCAARHG